MESIVVYTEEIDDLEYAARELVSGAEDFAFRKNTLGILFAEDETEFEELYGILSESWSFPIIGCSGMALMTAENFGQKLRRMAKTAAMRITRGS